MSDPRGPGFLGGLGEDVDLAKFREQALAEERVVEVAPAKEPRTPKEWIRQNLFSGWFSGLITVLTSILVAFALFHILRFIFVTGDWEVVQASFGAYMTGSFPDEELWRVWTAVYAVAVLSGLSWGMRPRPVRLGPKRIVLAVVVGIAVIAFIGFVVKTGLVRLLIAGAVATLVVAAVAGRIVGERIKRPLLIAWALLFPFVIVMLRAFDGVPPQLWEGFLFNVLAAAVGIFASFPIGIALALGRRSSLPAVRTVCVVFIEIFRGVPLVAWLIFSKFVFDILLPPNVSAPPNIIKSLAAFTLFSSAYVAEIVRGGLQGVHFGQFEAGRALGLSTTRMMALVILPQALRSTIPAMISHFISLFKDTALFSAIDVSELLDTARRSSTNLQFLLTDMQTLLFAALVFWIIAFSMSRWSQRLEVRLGVGER